MIEGMVFREKLLHDVPTLSPAQLELCQEDLVEMATAENWEDELPCYLRWVERLGGLSNVISYAESLEAMARRLRRKELMRFSDIQLALMADVGDAIKKATTPGASGYRGEALKWPEVAEVLEFKLKQFGFKVSVQA